MATTRVTDMRNKDWMVHAWLRKSTLQAWHKQETFCICILQTGRKQACRGWQRKWGGQTSCLTRSLSLLVVPFLKTDWFTLSASSTSKSPGLLYQGLLTNAQFKRQALLYSGLGHWWGRCDKWFFVVLWHDGSDWVQSLSCLTFSHMQCTVDGDCGVEAAEILIAHNPFKLINYSLSQTSTAH